MGCCSVSCCSDCPRRNKEAHLPAPEGNSTGLSVAQGGAAPFPWRHGNIAIKEDTSVTMLSIPWIRFDVPNRDGFPDTADRTFWTNAESWIGSAQMGPPSYTGNRHTRYVSGSRIKSCLSKTTRGDVSDLMSLSAVLALGSDRRTCGGRILHPEDTGYSNSGKHRSEAGEGYVVSRFNRLEFPGIC